MASKRIRGFLFGITVWLVVLFLVAPTFSQEAATAEDNVVVLDDNTVVDAGEPTTNSNSQEQQQQQQPQQQVAVDDYLDTMSNEELETICRDRGFELANTQDGVAATLTRQDYLEAARRCLSLEQEMNAILAENPDLAFELEAEIERMRQEKERLEQERQEMLAEITLLQMQLERAGVDIQAAGLKTAQQIRGGAGDDDTAAAEHVPQTFEEVLKESLTEVFVRVRRDVKMVYSALRPVLVPIGGALKMLWRYAKPILAGLYQKGVDKIKSAVVAKKDDDDDDDGNDTTAGMMKPPGATAEPPR